MEGLWTYLNEILHSKQLCNVLSTEKIINIHPAVPQVGQIPGFDFVLNATKLHTVFKYSFILLNISVPDCFTSILYSLVVKSFMVQI